MQAWQRWQPSYLQAVVQGKVLVALACGEQQMTGPLGLSGFVPGHLSIFCRRCLQVVTNPDELLASFHQLGEKSETHVVIRESWQLRLYLS